MTRRTTEEARAVALRDLALEAAEDAKQFDPEYGVMAVASAVLAVEARLAELVAVLEAKRRR